MVLYRVLFHYFERFLTEYEGRFEKEIPKAAELSPICNVIAPFFPNLVDNCQDRQIFPKPGNRPDELSLPALLIELLDQRRRLPDPCL
jgi:hypothetical protein